MTCPSSRLTHRVARMEGQVITGTYRAPVARALPVKEIQTLLRNSWTLLNRQVWLSSHTCGDRSQSLEYILPQYSQHTNLFLLGRHKTVCALCLSLYSRLLVFCQTNLKQNIKKLFSCELKDPHPNREVNVCRVNKQQNHD